MNRRVSERELREIQMVRASLISGRRHGLRDIIIDAALATVAAVSFVGIVGWVYLGCPL